MWTRTNFGKWQYTTHTRQPRGQPFPSRWPQGYKEQKRHYKHTPTWSITNKNDPKKKHRLGTVSKIYKCINLHTHQKHKFSWPSPPYRNSKFWLQKSDKPYVYKNQSTHHWWRRVTRLIAPLRRKPDHDKAVFINDRLVTFLYLCPYCWCRFVFVLLW